MKKRIGQISLAILLTLLFFGHALRNAYFVTILLPNEYNENAPVVGTACRNDGTANMTYSERAEKSWVRIQKIGSQNSSSSSSSALLKGTNTMYPMEPGIYTVVTRKYENFDVDPTPDDGLILSYLFVIVPDCSK